MWRVAHRPVSRGAMPGGDRSGVTGGGVGPVSFVVTRGRRDALTHGRAAQSGRLCCSMLSARRRRRHRMAGAITLVLVIPLAACERVVPPAALTIVGTDYAFIAPDTVPAGPAVMTFENRGRVSHEMVLVRLRDDVSNAVAADSLSKGARMVPLRATGSGVLFPSPGSQNSIVRLRTEFHRGERYALYCQTRDSATAPKHNQLGMFKLLTVR
jgi:hypothetical protein